MFSVWAFEFFWKGLVSADQGRNDQSLNEVRVLLDGINPVCRKIGIHGFQPDEYIVDDYMLGFCYAAKLAKVATGPAVFHDSSESIPVCEQLQSWFTSDGVARLFEFLTLNEPIPQIRASSCQMKFVETLL
jgi:hypothetical protein